MKIIINAATHGDEKIGLRVSARLKKYSLKKDQVTFNVANPHALSRNKRFVDQDLNRSFPGKINGNYEERRAQELAPLIKSADIVFDIHSTTSSLEDAVIITKLTSETKKILEIIAPKYVLIMNATKNNALISQAKIGIAFEYGKDTSEYAIAKTTEDIKRVLIHLKIMEGVLKKKTAETVYFNVTHSVPKPPGFILLKNIKNYKQIKKGQVYAKSIKTSETLVAKENFYPILFGEKKYNDYFGFAGSLA